MKFSKFFGRGENAVTPQASEQPKQQEKRESETEEKKYQDVARVMESWYNKHILFLNPLPPENVEGRMKEERQLKNDFLRLTKEFDTSDLYKSWLVTADSSGKKLDDEFFIQCITDLKKPYGVF